MSLKKIIVADCGAVDVTTCFCGRDKPYEDCCGRVHAGAAPVTAEDLMRARYCAFVKGNVDFLAVTLHPDERAGFNKADVKEFCQSVIWTGLTIHKKTRGGPQDKRGTVKFTASFIQGMSSGEIRENSLFERLDGRWFYVKELN